MKPGYVPMGKPVRAVEIALYVMIVVDLVSIVSTMSGMSLLGRITARGAFSVEEIQSNDSRQRAIAMLGLLVAAGGAGARGHRVLGAARDRVRPAAGLGAVGLKAARSGDGTGSLRWRR